MTNFAKLTRGLAAAAIAVGLTGALTGTALAGGSGSDKEPVASMRAVDDASYTPEAAGERIATLRPFGDSSYVVAGRSGTGMQALNDSTFQLPATAKVANPAAEAAPAQARTGSTVDWVRVGILSGLAVLALAAIALARRPRRPAPAI